MKALITGASSGLGWEMAHILSDMGYDIIAVARRLGRLEMLRDKLETNVEIISCDVTDIKACKALAERAGEVDILINNAGFGVFGGLCENDLEAELAMIDTNIRAVHVLTKLFAQKFREKNSGYILNVASLAAFFPGPLFGAYYASKSYVLRLSQALAEELRREGSDVKVSVLCPGPVHTEFGEVAKVSFGRGNERAAKRLVLSAESVAKYAVKQMFKGRQVIIPGAVMRLAAFLRRICTDKMLARTVYLIQSKKCKKR